MQTAIDSDYLPHCIYIVTAYIYSVILTKLLIIVPTHHRKLGKVGNFSHQKVTDKKKKWDSKLGNSRGSNNPRQITWIYLVFQ